MSGTKQVGKGYQQNSSLQRGDGKKLIDIIEVCRGDVTLDLGCGTGELSAYLAELVGQDGKVVAVDPDVYRLDVARESHRKVKNLTFEEGSSANFPGMGSETYDMIFSNYVLHWIQNKEKAFSNMFRSLKPGGKIAMSFAVDCLLPTFEHVYRELNPENLDRILSTLYYESRSKIEEMCTAVGFDIVKSFEVKMDDFVYENVESMYSFFWATFQGAFDRQLVTKDRLARFCARYTSGENSKPFKVFAVEGDYICVFDCS